MTDLEYHARKMVKEGYPLDLLLKRLSEHTVDADIPEAIVQEVTTTNYDAEDLETELLKRVCLTHSSGVSAAVSGMGCRGTGDFMIHHQIASLIGQTGAVVDPLQQDDGGVVELSDGNEKYVTVAVDGMHSRLSHFPFLAGFHAARAALRDVIVMGARPVAMFSDIHLANDGDISKIFDYTAGICAVGELCDVPLVSGSTLRIGGDVVLGDRLTGSVGAVGAAKDLTPRSKTTVGDVLIMSEGSGGGTITTTALYNGVPEVVERTINVDFILVGKKLLSDRELMSKVHSMTDVTNGGIRGDALEMSKTVGAAIVLDQEKLVHLIDPEVQRMLSDLDIDSLGVSIDSLLITCSKEDSGPVLEAVRSAGVKAEVVGVVEEGSGVFLESNGEKSPLEPRFREAPYTPVKRIVDTVKYNKDVHQSLSSLIEQAAQTSAEKRDFVTKWIRDRNGI